MQRDQAPGNVGQERSPAAAARLYGAATTVLTEVDELYSSGSITQAADTVLNQLLPVLDQLDALAPPDQDSRTAHVHTRAAMALSDCAAALVDQKGSRAVEQAREWYSAALRLVVDEPTTCHVWGKLWDVNAMTDKLTRYEEELAHLARTGEMHLAREVLVDLLYETRGTGWRNDVLQMWVNLCAASGLPPSLGE